MYMNKYYEKIDYQLLNKKTAYKGKRLEVEELNYKKRKLICNWL